MPVKVHRQVGDVDQRLSQSVDIGCRSAAKAAQQTRASNLRDHLQGLGGRDRTTSQRDILVHLHQHAAAAEQEHGSELWVIGHADDHFDAIGHHLLDDDAAHRRVRRECVGSGQHVFEGDPHVRRVAQAQPHDAGLGLVQDVG